MRGNNLYHDGRFANSSFQICYSAYIGLYTVSTAFFLMKTGYDCSLCMESYNIYVNQILQTNNNGIIDIIVNHDTVSVLVSYYFYITYYKRQCIA